MAALKRGKGPITERARESVRCRKDTMSNDSKLVPDAMNRIGIAIRTHGSGLRQSLDWMRLIKKYD